jgi:hypothetical protein
MRRYKSRRNELISKMNPSRLGNGWSISMVGWA